MKTFKLILPVIIFVATFLAPMTIAWLMQKKDKKEL